MDEAKRHYQTARGLNPVLVNYDSFDAYRNAVFASGAGGGRNNSGRTGHGGSSGASNGGGGSSGNGSGGGGNGNDDDAFRRWKLFELASPWVAKYKGKRLALDKEGKFWYSFDTARHGGAFLKKYRNKRSCLEFVGSVDKNWKDIPGKHESNEGVVIYKSDLDTVRRN